jgi:hypothetical protein
LPRRWRIGVWMEGVRAMSAIVVHTYMSVAATTQARREKFLICLYHSQPQRESTHTHDQLIDRGSLSTKNVETGSMERAGRDLIHCAAGLDSEIEQRSPRLIGLGLLREAAIQPWCFMVKRWRSTQYSVDPLLSACRMPDRHVGNIAY